ncbi:hypothetical protein [Proteus terrae]|uniref:hypothetical protein n=1 Tax=Proteus terrae TaxID=1574161 RepID=UPI002247CDFF|nr:hypothetical protein [Proteus terrae]MCW9688158.1 hypothetical protein [Proteus terrae]
MRFEELPVDVRESALDAYKQIIVREVGAVDGEYVNDQKARLLNLAETIATGFIKLYES